MPRHSQRDSLTSGISPDAIESWMNNADPNAPRLSIPPPKSKRESVIGGGGANRHSRHHSKQHSLTAPVSIDPIESWVNTAEDAGAPPTTAAPEPDEIDGPEEVLPETDFANPRNWVAWRKWTLTLVLVVVDLTVGFGAACFGPGIAGFREEFQVSWEVAILGITLYLLGLALGPLIWAPMSEFFGRTPVYIASYFVFLMMILGTALVHDLGGFLVLRALSGIFSSATTANLADTIADLWGAKSHGLPVSLFVWSTVVGGPLGYFIFSCIAETKPWRDIFWALLGICGGFWLIMSLTLLVLGETRHEVIVRNAHHHLKQENENFGRDATFSRSEKLSDSTRRLLEQALTRPFRFCITEATVIFCTLYIAYLSGLFILLTFAFPIVFGLRHGFSVIDVGLSFLSIAIGVSVGPLLNLWQERIRQRRVGEVEITNAEHRIGWQSKIAAITFPISLFWFSWATYSTVHWIVPMLASALCGWSFYVLVLMMYLYIVDAYGQISASALAGMGLAKFLVGSGFSLFGRQMFTAHGLGGVSGLSAQLAGTILACLGILLVPVPFVLEKYCEKLRRKSPWIRLHVDDGVIDEKNTSTMENGTETPNTGVLV